MTYETTLARWHQFVATGDPAHLDDVLADDIVFRAPAYWKERTGKSLVRFILMAVADIFEDFSYHREWIDGRDWALEFSARIGDVALKGVDLVHLDAEGRMAALEVMVRPPNAVAALRDQMEIRFADLA